MKYSSQQHNDRAQALKRAAFTIKNEEQRLELLKLSKAHRGLARVARSQEQDKPSPPKS